MTNPFPLRIRKALENKSNMEDDRLAVLENQLGQAKQIAEEADKKYEEVRESIRQGSSYHLRLLLFSTIHPIFSAPIGIWCALSGLKFDSPSSLFSREI